MLLGNRELKCDQCTVFFVLFTATVREDQSTLSDQYYSTLQPIVQRIEGFVDETPFADPSRANGQLLLSRFNDEGAIARWRNSPTHLRIMRRARHDIFEDFRVTIGTDLPDASAEADQDARMIVVHQTPSTEISSTDTEQAAPASVMTDRQLKASESFIGASPALKVWRLKNKADVQHLETSLARVPNDSVYKIHVVREYSKNERKEAPVGIDEAETAAGKKA
ncbi:hypothetical protein KVT40_008026 [Elsinoe batatas]|uniref:ABM domain-containing protein n=1 Tax=Elsinoe batatas TaxID=2601811 RepID=A0A8K0KW55_9PEZI|nr:hypothetical protein KVT40_008026 [Elsinoe batatas]